MSLGTPVPLLSLKLQHLLLHRVLLTQDIARGSCLFTYLVPREKDSNVVFVRLHLPIIVLPFAEGISESVSNVAGGKW